MFNERVLQEAEDKSVPLLERLRFLGIFSNNRDEFFRVRVATLKRMEQLGKKEKAFLNDDPTKILSEIQEIVLNQERKFEKIYSKLRKELENHDIYMINEKNLSEKHAQYVLEYFRDKVRGNMVPIVLNKDQELSILRDKGVYLAIKVIGRKRKHPIFAVVEIPVGRVPRFTVLPTEDGKKYVIMLDDIIRFNLKEVFQIFDPESVEAYTFKITRDAELDIDNGISESWIDKLAKSLKNRKTGDTVRFVHDKKMPQDLYQLLVRKLEIEKSDSIVPGERYHNFKDFMNFPNVGAKHLRHKVLEPNPHPFLMKQTSIMDAVNERDVLLHFPYQRFSYLIDLLREAAIDPKVTRISINLYRVANESKVINALINAARNGKEVMVVLELTARFDEENNIRWSNKLSEEGVTIVHGVRGLKVHSKLILIEREGKGNKDIAHVGTGNFHEGTAKIYGDMSLLTSDDRVTNEIHKVFEFFSANYKRALYRNIIVSPFNTRRRFGMLIDNEIANAKKGKPAYITLKLNNLVDEYMIRKLYEAGQNGVRIKLLIRGICSLVPGVKGMSDNIEAYSIVDRFLEHSRIMIFGNNGDELCFIGSADWMERNIDRRVEVSVPIYDKTIKKEINKVLDIQFKDNVKRRILDKSLRNDYVVNNKPACRSQIVTYNFYKSLVSS